MFPRIICDPDVKAAEGRATGLFYTAISRGTTLGDASGLGSAIYFTGPNLTRERIQELTLKANTSHPLVNVRRRDAWVNRLATNTTTFNPSDQPKMDNLFAWIESHRISYDTLFHRTLQYIQLNRRSR
jgi:hypothetical protein